MTQSLPESSDPFGLHGTASNLEAFDEAGYTAACGRLTAELGAFATNVPMSAEVTGELAVDSIPLYYSGLRRSDAEYAQQTVSLRRGALQNLDAGWEYTLASGAFGNLRANIRRSQRAMRQRRLQPGDAIDPRISAKVVQDDLSHMQTAPAKGFGSVSVLHGLLPRLQLLYASESPTVWKNDELNAELANIPPEDLQELYEEDPPADLTFVDLATDVRSVYGVDLSKEKLDARFRNFVGLAQFGLASLISEDLARYALTGGSRMKRAGGLIDKHRANILGDDLLAKQQTLRELSLTYSQEIANLAGNAMERKRLQPLSARARSLATNLDEYLAFFNNVYTSLGYDLPAVLESWHAAEEAPAPPVRTARVCRPAGAAVTPVIVEHVDATQEEPMGPFLTTEEQAELDRRAEAIEAEVEKHLGNWRQSKTQRDRQGFGPLATLIMNGLEVPDESGVGNWRLDQLPFDTACAITDALVQLHRLSQGHDVETARQHVATALEHRRALNARWDALYAEARDRGAVAITNPRLPDIADSIQRVANRWHLFRAAIIQAWPDYAAHPDDAVLGRIWQLLPPPEPGSPYATLLEDYERRYKFEF